jgi:hypothetical protein
MQPEMRKAAHRKKAATLWLFREFKYAFVLLNSHKFD